MNVWTLIGGLLSLTALGLWVKWLLTPSSSTWHQGYLRSTLMYGVPGFLGGLTVVLLMRFAESVGVPATVITGVAALPVLICLALGVLVILVYAGVPAPPFCVPKWIRTQDRERRTRRKARKQQQTQQRTTARDTKNARQRGN